jgi:two-component system CheB/CheR fusion protein
LYPGQVVDRPLAGIRVLVVEDHADSRDALQLTLDWLGATVWLAGSGPEALTIAARESPDLVLCDLRLPGMDGFALLAGLRALPAAHPIRVIAVTGCDREKDIKRTQEAGFDGHLVKPLDFERLVQVVEAGARAAILPAPSGAGSGRAPDSTRGG